MGLTEGGSGNALSRPRAAELMIEEVLDSIARGDFRPGDRLGSENDLIRHFGLSRAVVREALRILEREEVVSVKPGPSGGVFCQSPGVRPLSRSIDLYGSFHHFRPQDLAEARLELEVITARLAAERATPEDLERLEQLNDQWIADVENGRMDGARTNVQFHLALAAASHNPVLVFFMNALEGLLYENARETGQSARRPNYVAYSHEELLEPVRRRDAAGAAATMRRHLEVFRYRGQQLPAPCQSGSVTAEERVRGNGGGGNSID